MGFFFYRFCGGALNPRHNRKSGSPVTAPILGRLYTLDVRTGDPAKYPTRHQDGAGEAGGLFTGLSKSQFNPPHHAPGFRVKFDQLSSPDLCPIVSMSKIGVYKT